MDNTSARALPDGRISVVVPRDAEADLITALHEGWGIEASTMIRGDVKAGDIRIQRVGGDLSHADQRDNPTMLIETWAADSVTAWDMAIYLWACIRTLGTYPELHPAHGFHLIDLQVPRSVTDLVAPDLHSVQFTLVASIGMTTLEI